MELKKVGSALVVGCAVIGSASLALATPTPIIDLTSAASDLTSLATDAIQKAVPVGVLVLGAIMGWKFFKKFVK